MLTTSAIALSGMSAAQTSLQAAAHNIANLSTGGFRRQQAISSTAASGGVSVSLSTSGVSGSSPETDMVGLLQAKDSFLANLAVFKTSDRVLGSLLDAVS
jgi:flagellar hook protein FlgE